MHTYRAIMRMMDEKITLDKIRGKIENKDNIYSNPAGRMYLKKAIEDEKRINNNNNKRAK